MKKQFAKILTTFILVMSLSVIALIIGIIGFSRFSVNATDEATVNQENEEKFVEYVKDNPVDKTADIDAYYSEDGDMAALVKNLDQDEIYEVGNNIIISNDEVNQYEKFFSLNGDVDAQKSAEEYAEERNALYVASLEEQYKETHSATDNIELDQMWTNEYENIKKTLVEDQNFVAADEY
jgi:hypothetical protein